MRIETYKPSPILSSYIKYYWVLENSSYSHSELVYPTGEIQILFHFKTPFTRIKHNIKVEQQFQTTIFGQITEPNEILSSCNSGVIGVVLHSFAAPFFFPFSLHEILNRQIDLNETYKEWTEKQQHFIDITSYRKKIDLIENFLLKKIRNVDRSKIHIVKQYIDNICSSSGKIQFQCLNSKLKTTEKTIQRIFKQYIGITAKEYAKIIQLNSAIKQLSLSKNIENAVYSSGYYDQSHFIKTFKKYTGLTPKQFIDKN